MSPNTSRFFIFRIFLLKASIFFIPAFFCVSKILPPLDFNEAKKSLYKIYQEHRETFYCSCLFDEFGHIITLGPYLPENTPAEQLKLEWEHIVPASLLGKNLSCWNKESCTVKARSNRECCRLTSKDFREREGNLYNLVPSIRLANRLRSNYKPGIVVNKLSAIKVCKIHIDKKRKVFEPDDSLKGFIARTYLKMDALYSLPLSDKDRLLFQNWDLLYPRDDWERRREEIIDSIYSLPTTFPTNGIEEH
jgi:deoxyribonuclease-1